MSHTPDPRHHDDSGEDAVEAVVATGVDDEPVEPNRRLFTGWHWLLFSFLAIAYSSFHLISLNVYPMETWSFRIVHIAGALILGYALYTGASFTSEGEPSPVSRALTWASYALLIPAIYALV